MPLSEETKAILRADTARRLHRTEAAIAASTEEERLGLASWLGGMLRRPPLADPAPAWRAMRDLVDALWWDLADRTADPLEPLAMHPRLDESNPWGKVA